MAGCARSSPRCSLHLAGEGSERPRLEELSRQVGLADALYLPGAQRDVPAFLGNLDVAVLASRAEGMSNAVLEYMAAARPCVATAVGATPELIRHEQDGLLVPAEDAAALAAAIGRLLHDRGLARRLAVSARTRAAERYSRSAMVRRFEDFYTRLVHGSEPLCHAT